MGAKDFTQSDGGTSSTKPLYVSTTGTAQLVGSDGKALAKHASKLPVETSREAQTLEDILQTLQSILAALEKIR